METPYADFHPHPNNDTGITAIYKAVLFVLACRSIKIQNDVNSHFLNCHLQTGGLMSFLKNLLSLLRKSPESQKKITEDDIRGDDTRMAVSARGEKLKDVPGMKPKVTRTSVVRSVNQRLENENERKRQVMQQLLHDLNRKKA
ncbi:MAG: hypothetical protein GX086_04595 [Alcaligenaceae bacterium]|nr:hypothetical protein [Alcaligenaceae bacterium]